jgi:hypothetical protein
VQSNCGEYAEIEYAALPVKSSPFSSDDDPERHCCPTSFIGVRLQFESIVAALTSVSNALCDDDQFGQHIEILGPPSGRFRRDHVRQPSYLDGDAFDRSLVSTGAAG